MTQAVYTRENKKVDFLSQGESCGEKRNKLDTQYDHSVIPRLHKKSVTESKNDSKGYKVTYQGHYSPYLLVLGIIQTKKKNNTNTCG